MVFEVFQGVHNHWYWRLLTAHNKKIAFCSEGYIDKNDALKGIELVKSYTATAAIKELAL